MNRLALPLDRAVRTLEEGYVQHPARIWQEPEFAEVPIAKMITEYVTYLRGRAQATSPATIEKYRKSLLSFARSIEAAEDRAVLASVTPAAGDRWVSEQRSRNLAEEGIASRQAAVKTWTRAFLSQGRDLTHWDLLGRWRRVALRDQPKDRLSEAEIEQVLDSLDNFSYGGLRDRALFMTYLTTGLRLSEVLGMTVAGLDTTTGDFTVSGKGGKERPVRVSPSALKVVRRWLRARRDRTNSGALWTTDVGEPLTFWAVQGIFRRLRQRSGVERLHAHLLRHTFGQVAIEKGAERALVQDMLGHATDRMTRRYTQTVRSQDAARQMPRFAAR